MLRSDGPKKAAQYRKSSVRTLFPDAESGKNLSEQVIAGYRAGDPAEFLMSQPQVLGDDFQPGAGSLGGAGGFNLPERGVQCLDMARPRTERGAKFPYLGFRPYHPEPGLYGCRPRYRTGL